MAASLRISSQEVDDRIYTTGEWFLPNKDYAKRNDSLIDGIIVQAKKEGNGSLEFKIRNFLNRAKEHGALGKKPNFWKRLNILVFRLAGKQNHYVLVINKHVYQILVNNKGWMYQTKI